MDTAQEKPSTTQTDGREMLWSSNGEAIVIELGSNRFVNNSGSPQIVDSQGEIVEVLPTTMESEHGSLQVRYEPSPTNRTLTVTLTQYASPGQIIAYSDEKNEVCFAAWVGTGALTGGVHGLLAGVVGAISTCPGYHW